MSQDKVRRFMQECPQPMNPHTCIVDLASEVGELAKEINMSNLWGSDEVYIYRDNTFTELGQVLFMVYQLAEVIQVDAEEALNSVLADFRARYSKNGHTGNTE